MKNITMHVSTILALLFLLTPFQPGLCEGTTNSRGAHQSIQTQHFSINYPEGYDSYANDIGNMAESIFPDLATFANYTPTQVIQINIIDYSFYPGTPLGIASSYGIQIPFISEWLYEWHGMTKIKQVVAHELHHLFLSRKHNTTSIYSVLPNWYAEGLANYYSGYDGAADDVLRINLVYLTEQNSYLPLANLTYTNGPYNQAHIEGWAFFKYIEMKYNQQMLSSFIDAAESNLNVEAAIQSIFGMNIYLFDSNLKTWVYDNFTKGTQIVPTIYGSPLSITNTESGALLIPTSWNKGKILCSSNVHGYLQIFRINEDGSNSVQLTEALRSSTNAIWSPDGSKILFTSNRDGNYGVYTMDPDGNNTIAIILDQFINIGEQWSPDGKKILFSSSKNGNYDIFSSNIDGTDITQMTNWTCSEGWPVFTPNGENIIFISNKSGSYGLYMMDKDGANVRLLVSTANPFDWISYPYCSHDGNSIFYQIQQANGTAILYTFNLATNESQQIIGPLSKATQINVYNPIWSEDGTEILFAYNGLLYRYNIYEKNTHTSWQLPILVIIIITVVGMAFVLMRRRKSPKSRVIQQEQPPNNPSTPPPGASP